MLAALRCHWLGHRVNRHRVKYDGLELRSHCLRCGVRLVRQPQGWREDAEHPEPTPNKG